MLVETTDLSGLEMENAVRKWIVFQLTAYKKERKIFIASVAWDSCRIIVEKK